LSPSIFEQNLEALHRDNPSLADVIRHTNLQGFPAELIPTKTQAPSLRVTPPDQTAPVLLHSAYDPLREAQRWVDGLAIPSQTNVILLGMGLGYPLWMLAKQKSAQIRNLLVIEKDPRIFLLALQILDWRPLLSRPHVHWLVGLTPSQIIEQISNETWTDILLHNCRLCLHDPSSIVNPGYYKEVHQILVETIAHEEVNIRTTFENRGRNQFNLFMNLPGLLRGYTPKAFQNRFAGWPALVAAAGPSLDRNIHHLHSIADRAGLFIVDTAQKTFARHRIPADAVVTGDPTPLNFSHFEPIDTLGESFLIFHPEVQRQIVQKYIHHPYLLPMYDSGSPLLNYLLDQETRCGTMERAMNVGHLAIHAALYMGFDPIILVGFDFAFPREGGTTHSKDAAVSRSISAVSAEGLVSVGAKEGKAAAEQGKMLLVPGIDGQPVPTTAPFLQYIRALERTVAASPCRFIDATEGGAAFEGTERLPLHEAMARFLSQPGVHARWAEIKAEPRNDLTSCEFIQKLQTGKQVLQASRATCTALWQQVEEWKRQLANPTLPQAEIQQQWQRFDQRWVAMVGDETFNAILGTAVHHLYFVRQRSTILEDDSPQTFLKSVTPKYTFILSELAGLLDNFLQTLDLAIQNIQTHP
jgi:hypothetical protein